jgi:tetratricopeptide (TPR) repeat protein
VVTASALCTEKTKAKPASSLLEQAEVARKTGDLPTAIKLYQQAIVAQPGKQDGYGGLYTVLFYEELNRLKAETTASGDKTKAPDIFDLNQRAMEAVNARLVVIYKKLKADHPRVTDYQYQLAMVEHRTDGKLTSAMEEIVASHPKFAPAVAFLAGHYAATGNIEKEREYYRRACDLDPSNALYAYEYLSTYKDGDQREYLRRVDEFLARFPKGDFKSTALTDAAQNATTTEDRIRFLERAAKLPGSYDIADLTALYSRTDIRKAANLAVEKVKEAQGSKDTSAEAQVPYLKKRADYYSALAHADEVVKAGQLNEAKAILEKATPPDTTLSPHPDEYAKTKLMSEILVGEGKPQDAYKYLLDDRQTIGDLDRQAAAVKLGAQLGKSEAQVKDDVVAAVLARAKQPSDFELENLKGDAKVKLSDLRGKYVLMNEWHPT